jgi:hypothetical protein
MMEAGGESKIYRRNGLIRGGQICRGINVVGYGKQ